VPHDAKAVSRSGNPLICQEFHYLKGNTMAFKPNYGMQRADRNRSARARSEQKQRAREEKSAQRKAERAVETNSPPDDDKTPRGS